MKTLRVGSSVCALLGRKTEFLDVHSAAFLWFGLQERLKEESVTPC